MNWVNAWWQEVSSNVANGLQITVAGMALVFLTLGLIIAALVLLRRLPGLSKESEKEQDLATISPPEKTPTGVTTGTVRTEPSLARDQELAQVAAIAVALLHNRRTRILQPRYKTESSRWKQYGRAHQLEL